MAEIQTNQSSTAGLEISIPSTFAKEQALDTPSTVATDFSSIAAESPLNSPVEADVEVQPEVVEKNAEDSFETAVEEETAKDVLEEEQAIFALDKPETKPVSVTFDLPNDAEQSDEDNAEETTPASALVTPRSGGISFAQAFATSPLPASMSPPPLVLKSPTSVSSTSTKTYEETDLDTPTSHSALSASKNRRASELIAKYQEKVAHSARPGDAVPLRSPGSSFQVSPGTTKKSAKAFIEQNSLPDMNSVRSKFEKSSRRSHGKFEFGESFRQKQRHEQLSEKQNKEEAKVSIRGFNEKILNNGKTATAEIDTSNLPKSFTFDLNKCAPVFPNDGICRVDYTNADFRAKVFVVHKTRGMLILQDKHATPYTSKSSGKTKKKRKNTVPGGKISEDEFLAAAKENGSPQVQLQIAAREAAARLVFESTGFDIRQQADRLKPAVLSMTPSMNTARGYENLRNENDEKLYYFLQVTEEDFENLQPEVPSNLTRPSEDAGDDPAPAKLKRPSQDLGDEPLTLKLSDDYSGYEFVPDPAKASKVLKKDGNDAATALAMIMKSAAREIHGDETLFEPDAKATEYDMSDDEDDDDDEDCANDGAVRTVGEEQAPAKDGNDQAKPKSKAAAENIQEEVGVDCCCGFW